MTYHLAIDIGASSGRHILGHIENGKIVLEEVYRFDNIQVLKDGHSCWDTEMLKKCVLEGIKKCGEIGKIPSTLGIDTWGVDYMLIDKDGNTVCDAVAYRDSRTDGMVEKMNGIMPFEKLYEKTGIQCQPYNTVYQLLAHKAERPEDFEKADRFLMIPDYLNYILTGIAANEYTNATTTSLVNAAKHEWDKEVIEAIGVPYGIFGELKMPKTYLGGFSDEVKKYAGFDCKVILPATHDTGSAYMAVPAKNDKAIYISSGTWSLLGVENSEPITTAESRESNFTNEGGYEFRFRYLKNIMGLWIIQSVRRELNGVEYVRKNDGATKETKNISFAELQDAAMAAKDFSAVIDVDNEAFLSPESMIETIKDRCRAEGQPVPETTGEIMQCVYASLAVKYAASIRETEKITGKKFESINIVGGGSRDEYLNRLTADKSGLCVYAGPTEGTALGNIMAQMIAEQEIKDLSAARKMIYESFDIKEFLPL